jgi:hypothetical protein
MSYSETRNVIVNSLGFFWTDVFQNDEFVDNYSSTLGIQYNDLNTIVQNTPQVKARRDIPVFDIEDYRIFVFDERSLDRDKNKYGDPGLIYGGGEVYGAQLSGDLEEYSYPIDPDTVPLFMSPTPFAEDGILQKDVDYRIEGDRIIFKINPLTLTNVLKNVVNEDGSEVQFFQFALWGFKTAVDRQNIQSFYGAIGGVTGASSDEYKEAMNIAWQLRVDGASVANLTKLLSLTTNVDYVVGTGQILNIFNEGDGVCVETENNVYCAPLGTPLNAGISDTINEADIIFDTFAIYDNTSNIPFEDFEGLLLSPEYTTGLIDSIYLPNEFVDVIQTMISPGVYEYSFAIGGTPEDKETFFKILNTPVDGKTFFDLLDDKYGRVPDVINPFQEIRAEIFEANAFFIKIKAGFADREFLGQLLGVFKDTLSAGSTFFLFDEIGEAIEAYNMTNASESATIFKVVEGTESGPFITEFAIVSQVVT